ncbi:hypothetical protein CFC21_007846 [Triticum aestivum]|uniref:Embryo surrounding factor 1 brassicaceae domain-containing protein n=2 Tax=Triticum aestivum TaxID=4565 RepID=A0A9R1DF08_WHEAT|nr:hypothetical protein CFC21_007846 [Triticum aestivum]
MSISKSDTQFVQNMKGGSVVYMIAFLFIGCLLMVGQCRPEPPSTYGDGHANATMAVSSIDESKVTVKFCVIRNCKTKGEFWGWNGGCYCCLNAPGIPCFEHQYQCNQNCPPIRNKVVQFENI